MDYRERWELKDYLTSRILARRLLIFHAGILLLILAFILNFWYLQGVLGEDYESLAENNRLRRIALKSTRGDIFDRNHQVIASTRPSLDLLLSRADTNDVDTQFEQLAPILGTTTEDLHEKLARKRGRPLYEPLVLKEDVSLAELAQIEARRERFPAVEVEETARRIYPHGGLFAHTLGYVGQVSEAQLIAANGDRSLHSGDIVGKSGVERAFDESVRGTRGWKVVSVNNLGRRVGRARVSVEPDHGADIELTIDLKLQQVLADAFGDETGAGVFIDPRNGEILAMLSAPIFDPNLFVDGISVKNWERITDDARRPLHDRTIASYYAPGSTFKVLMAIAGLESGMVPLDQKVFCNGSAIYYKRTRLCWNRGGHGFVDIRKALTESCNIYFYELGQQLGIETIHHFGSMFGLGTRSGVEIPGEEKGVMPSIAWKREHQGEMWYPGDTISVAIGQGLLAVTPIQLARMISGVATGGKLPRPHILKGNETDPLELPVSANTFRIVKQALKDAVVEGTGTRAGLIDISVAGKTGTAQVYKHSAGVPSEQLPKAERDHAWFVGYAPADDPQIAFAVVVEHGGHGGATAAPIVRDVLEEFFSSEAATGEESDDLVARKESSVEEQHGRQTSAR